MGENVGERAREEISSCLESVDGTIRMRALELVGQLNVLAAGPILVRRVQSDGFHELSADERRRWLQTICSLKASRGESLAVELLSKRRLLSTDASETSRAIAAEALADFDSPETVEALQAAAKQRWGTSAVVREAATKALAKIEGRSSKKGSGTYGAEGKA
jgi:HEAT repeat protein